MIEAQSIIGEVENGRSGVVAFPFYTGPVGIRDRDGGMEVAFFAPPMRYKLPVEGLVDGQRVRVTGIRARDFDPSIPSPARSAALRAIIATVIPIA